jgi:hypothetical protein
MNTPKFRVSWPKVFKPELNKLSGKTEYSITALFPKGTDLSAMKKAAENAIIEKWGADKIKWPKTLKSPFRDQGEKEVDGSLPAGYEKGAIFINLKSKNKPGVVDQNVQAILDEADFYAGCYAIASVNAYAYDQAGNRGVSFGLNNIQKVADGEPLSGRSKPENDFAAVATTSDDDGSSDGLFN